MLAVSAKVKKQILKEYYDEGLTFLEIASKHRSLEPGELKKIISESQE